MGLDFTTTDDWSTDAHWSYSGFNSFRRRLARTAGIELDEMQGFTTNGAPWTAMDSALVPLLNHSDCDGELTATECELVFPALRSAVQEWPDDDYDRHHALLLADLMEHCAETGVALQFC